MQEIMRKMKGPEIQKKRVIGGVEIWELRECGPKVV